MPPMPRVALVGAGPGDPGLITARGLELLRAADVVVHDALVLPALLAEAKPDAEVIDVGKRHSDHKLSQDQINALLAAKAGEGRFVVRLKGGDPFVFGRGAEEAQFLHAKGIAVEIVPGVTTGVAAPAMAGIPVTHRDHSSTVTFITGHEGEGEATGGRPRIDYAALGAMVNKGGTLCIYMGISRRGEIVPALLAALDGATPAAVVMWGATPRQRVLRTTLNNLLKDLEREGLWAPAIIVLGAVAAIDDIALSAYAARPLFGQRVVITRTRDQASVLRATLTALGAEVLEAPTIRIQPASDKVNTQIEQTLCAIEEYDWLVLTSANGVDAFAQRLDALKLDGRDLANLRIAAIGEATAARLMERLHLRADLVPEKFVAESLAEALIKDTEPGGRFLLLRADIARKALPDLLTQAGMIVDEFATYHTAPAESLPSPVIAALEEGKVDWITFTSSSTVRNLVNLLGPRREILRRVKLASIGPITTQTMRELGLKPAVEAKVSTIEGLVEAMCEHRNSPPS
ncbi:MAG: uroporphyrinogen-III C-methyltransferase [Phycisphaeraceae bacterium]